MHILLLDYFYDPGLATPDQLLRRYDSLTDWCASLRAVGAERVTVLQRYAHDAERERDGVRYVFRADGGRPAPRFWASLGRINRAAAELRPDLVHVNGMLFPAATRALRRALPRNSAIVVQDHAGAPLAPRGQLDARGWARRLADIAGLGAADAFLFTVDEQARAWRAAGIIRPHQPVYEVLESSRPIRPLPRAEARAATGLRGDPALLWVGRLNALKDPLTVLDGFQRALPRLPGARLAMCYSTSELLPAIQARLAEAPALAERVDLLGHTPFERVVALLSAADMFVLGSLREGSGYALIEAIACGAVPVVTDIPSFRSITGGALGRLWPVGDAAALASALVELGQTDLAPLRADLLAHFERELSWPAVGARALAIYREVVSRRLSNTHRL
jgi:glycosyltransferase involved in cell wall biosynthesis